ncbi:hypothetical protein BC835DRAFT_1421376 [Cytidiella melzeri]|nr:hypothetical protein BC835DRAFT_1421376 [Cytidiella melzeri]
MLWLLDTPLPMSPLYKVALIFVNAASIHAIYTPPHPIADNDETQKYNYRALKDFQFQFRRRAAACAKTIHWLYSASESALILARAFASPLSTDVLTTFMVYPENAAVLQITPAWLIGGLLMASGAFIRTACQRELGRFFTWELSLKKGQHLVTTGPYALGRHPAYTGTLLAAVGTFLCQLSPRTWMAENGCFESTAVRWGLWLSYTALVPYMFTRRTYAEDDVLREEFPEEWRAWAEKTPYKMIPYVF